MHKILRSLYITTETQRFIEVSHWQEDGKGLCLQCPNLPQFFIKKIMLLVWKHISLFGT